MTANRSLDNPSSSPHGRGDADFVDLEMVEPADDDENCHEAQGVPVDLGEKEEADPDPDVVDPIAIVEAEEDDALAEVAAVRPRPTLRGLIRTIGRGLASGFEWIFGFVSLIAGLAVLATLPVVQLLSLGYLLESGGRIARSGRFRDGFVGIRKAARVGSLVLGTWLVLWPARLIADMWYAANLVDPEGVATQAWRAGLWIAVALTLAHLLWAWFRGGRLRHFLWPAPVRFLKWCRQPQKYVRARDAVWDFVTSLHVPGYFHLGLMGFVGALAWLLIPIALFIGATSLPPAAAVAAGIFGSLMFAVTLLHLPLLQMHVAAERRWGAWLEVTAVYRNFYRAPLACWIAILGTLVAALPLYLLKIELTPQQVAFLPSLVFVVFILPSRLAQGWAIGRARRRPARKYPTWRMTLCIGSISLALPVIGAYVFVVFFTRYTSWYGVWSLFEQHAFLVPVPFLGG